MNAAPWQCNLRPSRLARLISGGLLLNAIGMVLALPLDAGLIKALIIIVMVVEGGYHQRRLSQRRGELLRESLYNWCWQGADWYPQQALRWLPFAVLLVAKDRQGNRLRMWLMQDNMPAGAWRTLRARCLNDVLDGEST